MQLSLHYSVTISLTSCYFLNRISLRFVYSVDSLFFSQMVLCGENYSLVTIWRRKISFVVVTVGIYIPVGISFCYIHVLQQRLFAIFFSKFWKQFNLLVTSFVLERYTVCKKLVAGVIALYLQDIYFFKNGNWKTFVAITIQKKGLLNKWCRVNYWSVIIMLEQPF